MIVLQYIRTKFRRFKTFVANRLVVIHEGSTENQWKHVDTAEIPANCAYRGLKPDDIGKGRIWPNGSVFWWKQELAWPM